MCAEPATVVADLEARETDWAIRPGLAVRGWGFNGVVPGPTLEARAGDTLVVT